MASSGPCCLFPRSFSPWALLRDCYHWRVGRAFWMLLANCTRILVLTKTRHWSSRRGISAGRDDVVDSGQRHSGAGKSSLSPPWKRVDHRHSSRRMPRNSEATSPSLSVKTGHQSWPGPFRHRLWRSPSVRLGQSLCKACFVVSSPGSLFLRHSERLCRVSAWAARGRVFRLRRASTSQSFVTTSCQFRSLMASFSPLQLWRCVECSNHISQLPHLLVHENGHSCRHVRESRVAVLRISPPSAGRGFKCWIRSWPHPKHNGMADVSP